MPKSEPPGRYNQVLGWNTVSLAEYLAEFMKPSVFTRIPEPTQKSVAISCFSLKAVPFCHQTEICFVVVVHLFIYLFLIFKMNMNAMSLETLE